MIGVRQLKGLRYPDEYVVKFFFKVGLDKAAGSMIELGCGNGNNMLLFYEYGWNVIGVDIDESSIEHGRHNLGLISQPASSFQFIQHDLTQPLSMLDGTCDVLLIPNVIHNLLPDATTRLFDDARRLTKPGTHIFLRTRSVRDYRFNRGRQIGPYSFIMTAPETGELDTLQTFYYEYELVDLLRDHLGVATSSLNIFTVEFENLQGGVHISRSSDIVIWGICGG